MQQNGNRKPRPRSIAFTVATVFSFLSVAVLLVVSGIQMYVSFVANRDEVHTRLQLVAKDASKTVSNFVQDKFGKLEAAARFGDLATVSDEERRLVLNKLLGGESSFRQLTLFDLNGRELSKVSLRSSFRSVESTNFDRDALFTSALNNLKYISQVFVEPETNEPEIFIAIPVTNAPGDVLGVLIAELNLKFMWNVVDGISVGDTGHAYVVDRQGNLLAFGDTSRVLKGENVSELELVQNFITGTDSGNQILRLSKGILGTYVVGTSVALGIPDWAVAVELPVAEAYGREINSVVVSVAFILLFTLLVILFAIYLSKRIARPINALSKTASAIASGDLKRRALVESDDEIGLLARSFNQMVNSVIAEGSLRKQTIEILPDALFLTNVRGEIQQINLTVSDLLGYSGKDLLGKSIEILFANPAEAGLSELSKRGRINDRLVSLVAKDKTSIPVTLNGRVIKHGEKDKNLMLFVALDRRAAESLEKSKTEFVTIASHQLKTPLAGIKWSLEYLISGDVGRLNPEQQDMARTAFESVNRMTTLVGDLLNVARIDDGKFTPVLKPLSLAKLLKDTVENSKLTAQRKGVTLSLKLAAKLPLIQLDESKINLALENLVDNAIKYTPPGGKVSVSAKLAAGKMVVEVADTGIGIPQTQFSRLFDKFFRADNAVLFQTSGSGLGLYVVKNIIESHRGTINIASKEKKGTTITIILPLS